MKRLLARQAELKQMYVVGLISTTEYNSMMRAISIELMGCDSM